MSHFHEALVRAVPGIQISGDYDHHDPTFIGEGNLNHGFDFVSSSANQSATSGTSNAAAPHRFDRDFHSDLPATFGEEILKLVQRLFVFPNSHSPRTVVFSSVEGTASSEICFRAAKALAVAVPASVCLVSNGVPPHCHAPKDGDEGRGLTSAMTSSDPIANFLLRTTCKNLWFMPIGLQSGAQPYLFPSDQLRSRVLELKRQFDYILIDAPPVTSSPNAVVLGQMADGVILVVDANSTRREAARVAKETFEEASVKLFGAILNNHTPRNPEGARSKFA